MGVVRFSLVRPGGRWVHPGLFGSLVFALGVVGFIRGRWIQPVYLGSLRLALGSLGSSGVVGFTRVRAGGRWVD